jgi:hypothetical protein
MANKQWVTEPLNNNDKLNTVYYSPKKNIAPVKKKKKKGFFDKLGDVVSGAGKTALSAVNYLGQGALKAGEQVLDTALQIGSSKYNPYYMLHPEDLKSHQAIAKELIGKDATKELTTTLSGDENFNQNFLDKGSLVKSTNLGGKVITGIGEMLPSIATGGITTAAITTGITGYGSGIETAYQGGANRNKANLYGLGSSAINSATEMITGGIPGVKTKWLSGLDKVAEKGISKVGNEVAKSLVRTGYKVVGEGGEEAISAMLDPYLKNITYDKNAKIDWQNVIDSAVQGALVGGILNAPSTIGDVKQSIQTEKAKSIQNKPILPISSQIEKQTTQTDTNIPTIQNKPLETNIQSIDKNITINKNSKQIRNDMDSIKSKINEIKNNINTDGMGIFQKQAEYNKNDEYVKLNKEWDNLKEQYSKKLDEEEKTIQNDVVTTKESNIINSVNPTGTVFTEYTPQKRADSVLADNMTTYDKTANVNPNEKVTIYRGTPKNAQKTINPGDFITTNKELAKIYGENIIEEKVNAEDIIDDSQDALGEEYLYIPKNMQKFQSNNIEATQPIENIPFNEQTGEVIEQQDIMPSKFTKTAMSSKIVTPEAKKFLKETFGDERASYVPIDDKSALDNADRTIKTSGYDNSKATFSTKINSGQRLSKNDIVLGERLIQEAIDRQDFDTAGELINNVAIAGSELGQAVQALSVIKKMTPQGQLKLIDTIINRENNSNKTLQKQGKEVKLSKENRDAILNAKDTKELQNAATKAIEELSQQVPATLGNSLRSWRYLAMLGNPKTHIRNVVSNVVMKGVTKVKNEQAKILETIFNPEERTKKFGKVPKEIKDFVKNDALEMKDRIQGQDKYDLKSQFNLDKKSFSDKTPIGKGLNKLSEFNSKFLGIEDWMFSSTAYKENMANYMYANNINPDSDPKLIEKARTYAIQQAQEQTFTQFNELANKISQFEKNNKVANLVVGAILPFKKTPLNIAKAGVEYSPIGLAETMTKGIYDLKKGKINGSQFINKLSKGMTGTEIFVLGMIMADMGLLRGSGSDEEKEEALKKGQNYQPYSLQIGNTSISLDWMSPAAMPLFAGVEIRELSQQDKEFDLVTAFEALSTTLDPLTSMSMMQGINNTINSYDTDTPLGKIGSVGINCIQNYALQFFPTVGGQLARTMDDTRRSTIGEGKGIEKKVNTFVNKIKAKIPGLENTLEPYTDYFGREEVEKDLKTRAISNFLSPAYVKTIKSTPAEEEIQKLFTKTGEKSILPSASKNNFTIDGVKYELNSKEYTQFNKQDGGKALEILNKMVKSDTYKNLNDEQKVKVIEDTYKYTMNLAKETYSEKNNIPYELPTSMASLKKLEEEGTNVATYLSNKAYIDNINSKGDKKKSEVVNYLINQKLNDNEIQALYKSAGYTTDLSFLKKVNIPIKEYLKLEGQNIEATTNSIGTKVLRERKANYISAVNKLNLTIPQKALLIKNEYSSYDKYNNEIIKYVNNSSMTLNEKKSYLIGLGFKIKNGKVSW